MLLATSLNVMYDYTADVDRAVARVAAAGFEGVDFNGCDMMPLWRGPAGEEHLIRLQAAVERHGLTWVQAHGPMYDFSGPKAAEGDADTLRCIEWCGRLGIPWMVMHPTSVSGGGEETQHDRCLEANLAYYRKLLPHLERHGVGVAIENLSDKFFGERRFGSTPTELITICDALNHELVGLCWDTGHALLQRLAQQPALTALGSRLKVLHVQDNDGANDLHLLPFQGRIAWADVVAGLHGAGYQGAWTYEAHNSIRIGPDELRDDALRFAVSIGRWFTSQFPPA